MVVRRARLRVKARRTRVAAVLVGRDGWGFRMMTRHLHRRQEQSEGMVLKETCRFYVLACVLSPRSRDSDCCVFVQSGERRGGRAKEWSWPERVRDCHGCWRCAPRDTNWDVYAFRRGVSSTNRWTRRLLGRDMSQGQETLDVVQFAPHQTSTMPFPICLGWPQLILAKVGTIYAYR